MGLNKQIKLKKKSLDGCIKSEKEYYSEIIRKLNKKLESK